MTVKNLIRKYYHSILNHDSKKEKKYYLKLIRKSLRHKNTVLVK
jgi:hypothetical protein